MSEDRPLITFMVVAYNQERFIAEAVQGAFIQTYSPLEIILSDDCSADGTFAIMEEMAACYQGPHTVVLNRNERNLGLIGHINRVMEFAKGEVIVAAAGDDISLSGRVARISQVYLASERKAYSIFSNAIWIDNNSRRMNLLRKKPVFQESLFLESYAARSVPGFVTGATHAWRRRNFEIFGPLPEDVGAEDITIPFRSGLLGQIVYVHEPLVLYRRDTNRIMGQKSQYSFSAYRNACLRQRAVYLAMYRCRLKDLEHFQGLQIRPHDETIAYVGQITSKRIDELESISDLPLMNWLDFVKIVCYYQYQNLWRIINRLYRR